MKKTITIIIVSMAILALYGFVQIKINSNSAIIQSTMDATEQTPVTQQNSISTIAKGKKGTSTSIISAGQPAGTLDKSLANEVDAAINRGLDWLASQQKENGAWSNESFPALTALPVWAFAQRKHSSGDKALAKGVHFMLSCVQPDGGIYKHVEGRQGGGLSNYNTAICLTALHATRDRSLIQVILDARKFIANGQQIGGDVYDGGFGYDAKTDRKYADLLNTFYSAQAMKLTQDAEDSRDPSQERVDIDWAKTIKFIEQIQNKPEAGKDEEGGFFYKPGQSKAGETTNEQGVVVFRSYASMTYVGLLSLLYSDVKYDDPRVLSAFHWAARNWSLSENPGMGAEGQYFFYNVLSKSLSTYNQDSIPQEDGSAINWRVELAKKLVALQKVDPKTGEGYWINNDGRFWENDPVLVTAYTILALEQL